MATFDDLTSETKTTSTEGKRIALVVGTNNTKASSYLPDLKYAEDDAQEVYHTLRQPACNFEFICPVLTGDKAETRDVRRAVIKLTQEKADQDFLLFYFIGHAQPMKTKEGYDDIYFVTSDFNENEAKEDSTSHLSMRWLRDMLYRSDGAGRVLIILDCCYAGNIIHVGSDHSRIDLRTFIKGCIDGEGDGHQNGRLRVLLTATGYNTTAQERAMTNLFLSALQGRIAQVIDHKGNINIHSLYTYLQDQMPLAQLPNLSGDFPIPCILAHYPEKSHHLQFVQQAEENDRWHTVSQLVDKMSEISSVITDSDYFKRLTEASTRSHIHQFDRVAEETAFVVDLNQGKLTEFFKRDRVQIQDDFYPESTQQDQLQYFSFLQGLHPTHGALLGFGVNPTKWHAGAFTHCTLWRGNDQSNGWLDAQDYRRDLIAQFEAGRDFLRKSLRLARTISMDERVEELEIPLVALEEALANALVHREYENQTSPVYIDVFNNRVEISSPGVPPEPMTMELLEEEHKSHPRNPQIARIFYLYQYVEKVGSGIQRMQRALANAALPPAKFELGKDRTFKVVFYRPEQDSEERIYSIPKVASSTTVFYACAREDRPFLQLLEQHMRPLEQLGLISQWDDSRILPGTVWQEEIEAYLQKASIILLLISPDFLASHYCNVEMRRALARHAHGEARVIPILLRPVNLQGAPFAHLQCLPTNAKAVTTWINRDAAFLDLVAGIRKITEQIRSSSTRKTRLESSVSSQNRQRMLKKVRAFWVTGVFELSLHDAALITLGLHQRSEAVMNPWRSVVQESDQSEHALPPGTTIIQVYDNANGELLILGEPGAGKTTLLLELARDLLDRASGDETHPMPVVFNLSSWAIKRLPLAEWLVEELEAKYQVPSKQGHAWVNGDQILPLLDGLDEVAVRGRSGCVETINRYRQEHGLLPLVVCSRRAEYFAQPYRMLLSTAIVIQPLTNEQIDEYFIRGGELLRTLRETLQHDAGLQELATTPLMLNVLTLAYHGQQAEDLLVEGSLEEQRQRMFATYVARMLQRRATGTHYSSKQISHWLSWLAQQAIQREQAELSIKQLSPDWLPNNRLRMIYRVIVGLIFGAIFGMATGLLAGTVGGLLTGLIGGLIVALVFGLLFGMGLIRNNIVGHFVLRLLLWRIGAIPWNYTRFLDYAADHLLLQKVGDRYLFLHRLLMEYFANTERNVTSEVR